ncbi:pyridoxamine 5'-phosphate oxidase family protein [Patescibacteria group bacterium]|nr:pyridoxamine 5'-phosphate oxidase family protein [Patescibacteria group bacterium]
MDKKKIVFDFISKQTLAVLSTVNLKNNPESAVLEFGETENLELIFDTYNSARKYKNLKQNANVAFVIGWDDNITIQYSGKAEELSGEEKEKYKKIYFSKNPDAKRWENKKGMAYFKVTPSWIRYSDLNKNPWEIFEIKF